MRFYLIMGAMLAAVVNKGMASYRCLEGSTVRFQEHPCEAASSYRIVVRQPLSANHTAAQRLNEIRQKLQELEAERTALRRALDADLARLEKAHAQSLAAAERETERARVNSKRKEAESYLNLMRERERRYRSELRLLEQQMQALHREAQLLQQQSARTQTPSASKSRSFTQTR